MVLDAIRNLVSDKDPIPNKFTIGMGKLVRKAREEAGISQAELAQMVYRRQATLSDIENGKTELNARTLVLLATALNKPVTYFYPSSVYQNLNSEEFTPLEQELLSVFRNMWSDHLRKVAIDQARILSEFDPMKMIDDKWIDINAIRDQREELKKVVEDRFKKK